VRKLSFKINYILSLSNLIKKDSFSWFSRLNLTKLKLSKESWIKSV